MLDDADLVCGLCHSVRVDGRWERMETVNSRAWTLKETGSKSLQEYKDILTAGIETGKHGDKPTADDAEGW